MIVRGQDVVRICAKHKKRAVPIYSHCVGCEIEGLRESEAALRTENAALRKESEFYRAQCDMRDEWRDKVESELAALKDEIAQRQDTEDSLTKWVHDLGEELDALKDAARVALIDWRCCIVTGQSDAYDALAALVGEE